MRVSRGPAAVVIGGVLAAATVVAVAPRGAPQLDAELWREVAPVVHAALLGDDEVTWAPREGERWFCAERAVETRQLGDQVRVGLIARCATFARRGWALVTSSGRSGAVVVTLTSGPGGYRVHDVEVPVDGAGHGDALRRMFSPAGYEDVRAAANEAGPDPTPQARSAFELPADAPVTGR